MTRFGIRAKVFTSMVIVVTLLTLAFSVVAISSANEALTRVLKEKGVSSLLTLSMESELGVFSESKEMIGDAIATFEHDNDFFYAFVFNKEGQLIARDTKLLYKKPELPLDEVMKLDRPGQYYFVDNTHEGVSHLVFYAPVITKASESNMFIGEAESNPDDANYHVIGYVVFSLNTLGVSRHVEELTYSILTVFSLFLVVTFMLTYILSRRITGPIEVLAGVSKAVTAGDLSQRYNLEMNDEVGELANSFNQMLESIKQRNEELSLAKRDLEKKVADRTEELRVLNSDLTRSLTDLRRTQDQLVQSGKMAALGELVAGVAHEINTPLGIGVTAASHLESKVREYNRRYQENELTRADFEKFITMAVDTSTMILMNLNRAAEMVRSFKQVAVDQSDEVCRSFNINDYLNEVVKSLRPKIKKSQHEIIINCDDAEIYGYPGALYQIVSNLVMNSLIHGFEEGSAPGNMTINVTVEDSVVCLCYQDTGKGIEPKYLGKIFDPFFTTRRGRGGTGLGMHIIYNIISQKLGGTIRVESEVGKGVTFYIEFPAKVRILEEAVE